MDGWEGGFDAPVVKSTHQCEVVKVYPKVHPNADRLEVAEVGGYSVCVGKGDFRDGELGIYIPPDSIVPQIETFRFVWEGKGYVPDSIPAGDATVSEVPQKYRRIKAKTLRGVISEGLLIPIPQTKEFIDQTGECFFKEGDDVAKVLGITHYDPPDTTSLGGDTEAAPGKSEKKRRYPKSLRGWLRFLLSKVAFWRRQVDAQEHTSLDIPDYDVDAWQKFRGALIEGEEVWITEKIHGANSRFVYMLVDSNTMHDGNGGRMYCGSHHQWKKDLPGSAWWACLRQNPWIEEFCHRYPGYVLYGELVPTQKPYMYGQKDGKYRLFAFDVFDTAARRFLSHTELIALTWRQVLMDGEDFISPGITDEIHWVPTIYLGPYDSTKMRALAEGPSTVDHAGHIREGIIIKPVQERYDNRMGRVIMKLKSVKFLEKDK
jgi:hypothetical protein